MAIKGTVSLEGIEFFARHGVYDFEREQGNTFLVDVFITKNYEENELNNLQTTINYENVYELINNAMQTPEALLETVAKKIINSIAINFSMAQTIKVKIKKKTPPIKNAVLNYSAFEAEWERGNTSIK